MVELLSKREINKLIAFHEKESRIRAARLLRTGGIFNFDDITNAPWSTVATAPSPQTTGTTLSVQGGDGAIFPLAPFNVTVWPANTQPTRANMEILRVTSKGTGDNWTIVRTQEGTNARTIAVGDQIAATITAKRFTDIQAFLPYTTAGDVAYATSAAAAARLGIGAVGTVLRSTGSVPAWAGAATVATTISGAGAAVDGKVIKIRSGSTPFDHTSLIYDATYGKWVEVQERLASFPNSAASANNNIAVGAGYGGMAWELAVDTPRSVGTAGMHFQFTGVINVISSAADGTMFSRIRIADLYSDTAISGAGATTVRLDFHPWADFASAGDGWMYAASQVQKTGGTGTVAISEGAWGSIRSRLVG